MSRRRWIVPRNNRGMAIFIMVFLFLVLMPVILILTQWLTLHRRQTTQARVHVKEHYAGDGAANIGRDAVQKNLAGWTHWSAANAPFNATLYLDSGTVITTQITNTGTP